MFLKNTIFGCPVWVGKYGMQGMKHYCIFIMGVSGVGKSTIGSLLAEQLKIPFFDGDDYHSERNILKMSKGEPLQDEDRLDWLQDLNKLAIDQLQKGSCVIACSALKEQYRTILASTIEDQVRWVFLHGSFDQIVERMQKRQDHFMPTDLLQSQFNILEAPQDAIDVDISLSKQQIVDLIKKEIMEKAQFGLFGLGVMGKSLSRNLASKGFELSLFNRHVDGIEEHVAINFKKEHAELASAQAFDDIADFVNSLQVPRKIMLMVNAGKIVDSVIEDLLMFLSEGDIIVDGGNSNYNKTKQRCDYLKSKGIHFIGAGVSGGEEGALKGPSIMPGGNKEAYKEVQEFLEAIAAKDADDLPCCTYIGADGSGHFVKMVHNGIEYVEMQLLAEVYSILKIMGNNPDQIADYLASWKTTANSYLLDITIDILRKKEGDAWLIDKIVDKAGNKGTGNWATIATAQLGVPSTLITSALFARYASFFQQERIAASKHFESKQTAEFNIGLNELFEAYKFARLINHYQGFKLIQEASNTYHWNLNLSEIARIWTNGCIIKSDLMVDLVDIFKRTDNLLQEDFIIEQLKVLRPSIQKVVAQGVLNEWPIPNLSEAINFLNNFAVAQSSANLIQAQRDYFGAHTYQRTDDPSGKFYHTNWI